MFLSITCTYWVMWYFSIAQCNVDFCFLDTLVNHEYVQCSVVIPGTPDPNEFVSECAAVWGEAMP